MMVLEIAVVGSRHLAHLILKLTQERKGKLETEKLITCKVKSISQ